MSAPYRCGDTECWCAYASGLVVAPEVQGRKVDPTPLRDKPNHRGYMLRLLAGLNKERTP